jgi:hypothetical protein
MSDYGSFITSPLWERSDAQAIRYFRLIGWTEVQGDRGCIAFAGVLRDLSVNGLRDQVRGITGDLAAIMPVGDLKITLLEWGADEEKAPEFTVSAAREQTAEDNHKAERRRLEGMAVILRVERDYRDSAGESNPDLDAFLKS